MAANAQVTGVIEYRAGDGPLIRIPVGPIEVALAEDSAVLSWDDAGSTQSTAIPIADFHRHVREGALETDAPLSGSKAAG